MPPHTVEHQRMTALLEENQRLVTENNELLRKLYRNAVWSFWIRIVWAAIFIGLPFVIYFYVLQPYFEAFGASIEVFADGMREIPGWREFHEAWNSTRQ